MPKMHKSRISPVLARIKSQQSSYEDREDARRELKRWFSMFAHAVNEPDEYYSASEVIAYLRSCLPIAKLLDLAMAEQIEALLAQMQLKSRSTNNQLRPEGCNQLIEYSHISTVFKRESHA